MEAATEEQGEADPNPIGSAPIFSYHHHYHENEKNKSTKPRAGGMGRRRGRLQPYPGGCLRGVPSGLLDSSQRFLFLGRDPNLRGRAATTNLHRSGGLKLSWEENLKR
ncbi:hypothetical protein PIB30_031189 [Stylosanthes scabra]|uniref:Uncharacterized protein n=1 Tax=Stylosanthes scabra TaxID=79078 RepID=A0ABU6QBH7_9FABA|nr:hypothetical protein [Stylosanthes scabra]